MPTFSISKVASFENCPLKYKLKYVDKVKTKYDNTVEKFLGSMVHEALEKLYRNKQYEKEMTLDELLEYYNRKWEEEWTDSVVINKKDYTEENYRKTGERHLADYYNRHKPFDEGKILGLETQYYLSLDEEEEYKFHVRIDRLVDMGDGLYEVHDYKTGASFNEQEELDKDEQLAMYSLWVRRQFKDCKDVRLVWHMTHFDKERESYRTMEQLEELRKDILRRIKMIEEEEIYPGNVTNLCDWCEYKKEICPMWKHGNDLEAMGENEYLGDSGLKLADEYAQSKNDLDQYKKEAEAKLGKLKEAIIAFCEKEGIKVVFGSENKITLKESESIKFPGKDTEERQKLIEFLRGIHKLEEVSEPDIHALRRILKKREWEDEDLKTLSQFSQKEKSVNLSVGKK